MTGSESSPVGVSIVCQSSGPNILMAESESSPQRYSLSAVIWISKSEIFFNTCRGSL